MSSRGRPSVTVCDLVLPSSVRTPPSGVRPILMAPSYLNPPLRAPPPSTVPSRGPTASPCEFAGTRSARVRRPGSRSARPGQQEGSADSEAGAGSGDRPPSLRSGGDPLPAPDLSPSRSPLGLRLLPLAIMSLFAGMSPFSLIRRQACPLTIVWKSSFCNFHFPREATRVMGWMAWPRAHRW